MLACFLPVNFFRDLFAKTIHQAKASEFGFKKVTLSLMPDHSVLRGLIFSTGNLCLIHSVHVENFSCEIRRCYVPPPEHDRNRSFSDISSIIHF